MDNFRSAPPVTPSGPLPGVLGRFVTSVAVWSGGAVAVGAVLVVGNAILPPAFSPAHLIAVTMGRMVSDETATHTAITAELQRQITNAQTMTPSKLQSLKDSMEMQSGVANFADLACMASGLFSSPDYRDVRDGLRSTCGMSNAIRQNMMDQYNRNILPAPTTR